MENLKKLMEFSENETIIKMENEYQVQAYERKLKHQERMKLYALILKLGSLAQGLIAGVIAIVELFL